MSPTTVSRRLAGDVPLDINEIEKIATFLGVPVSRILGAPDAA